MARLLVLDPSANETLSTILRGSFLLSKDIMITSAQQIAMMQIRSNMIKPTVIQDMNLIGKVALVFIK
eukprot:7750670-Ditylum_brightwellii.AAC.1